MQKFIIYVNKRNCREIDRIINLIRFSLSRNHKKNFL